MTGVNLVIINPANRKRIYQSLATNLTAVEPPVWAGLMATYVRQQGYSVAIIDMSADNLSPQEAAERVQDLKPTLVAVSVYGHQPSASTQVMPGASVVTTAVKQLMPEQKVVLIGGHVAALPERTMREEDCDFVAAGEGLVTLAGLIEALATTNPDFSKILDLYWRDDAGQIQVNPPAPLMQHLDAEIPGIAWDLLPMDKYRAHNWHCFGDLQREPYAAIYTTLGCPYHCSFCCIQAPFKNGEKTAGMKAEVNSYRFWSVEHVLNEIGFLVNTYGVRNIKIADEMFVLNKRHVLGIANGIIERGYDVNIWAYTRVDTVKDDMIDTMKRAGINWLAFGIEAASEQVRDEVQKGVAQADIYRIIRQVQAGGINIIGNYIFGLPEDDYSTMQATLDMALDLNTEFANFYSAMAYPGSELYTRAVQQGLQLPDNWTGYSQHAVDTLPLPTNYLSPGEVLKFRDQAFMEYFTGERYLNMVEARFGVETRAHIVDMTSHKLEREFVAS